MTVLISVLNSH